MAKKEKILFRRTDGSGAGVILSHDHAAKFMEDEYNRKNYARETPEETKANQRAADEEAVEQPAAKKARG